MFNISNDGEHYDPHLLFYDSTLKMYAASYFASQKVESIKNNTINGYLNEDRNRRKLSYRNDLPIKYHLNLEQIQEGNSEKKCQKVIEKIAIDSSTLVVRFCMRKSQNPYAGYDIHTDLGVDILDSNFFNEFTVFDTVSYPIIDLCFKYKKGIIFTNRMEYKNHFIMDEMIVVNKKVLDDFYNQLWIIIHKLYHVQPE